VDICATVIKPLKTSGQHLASSMLLIMTLTALSSCELHKDPIMVVHACSMRRNCLQLSSGAGQHRDLLNFSIHVPGCYCPSNVKEDSIRQSKSVQLWFADIYSIMFTLWPKRWIVSVIISIARFTGGWGVTAPSSLKIPKASRPGVSFALMRLRTASSCSALQGSSCTDGS